jgi:hypothetical protein
MDKVTPDITRNPDAIWLSPACDGYAADRTWAAPAPEKACEECQEPWVRYVREDLATPAPDSEKLREALKTATGLASGPNGAGRMKIVIDGLEPGQEHKLHYLLSAALGASA